MTQVAIIGAGPYGLSIAAHLRAQKIEFRIFGKPLETWRCCMPRGMFLKSEGFATGLHDPKAQFSLKHFCTTKGLPYQATDLPVPLQTFNEYGLEFQRCFVPNLEEESVVGLCQSGQGFDLTLAGGEVVHARRVIVAIGITHFSHVPGGLAHLPKHAFSHSFDHHDLSSFKGRNTTVIGAGASAFDLAAGLYDAGAQVRLISRSLSLRFNVPAPRRWWKQWFPASGLGPGWRNQFYERGPNLFRHLPSGLRRYIVRSALPPAGGFAVKDRVERLPQLLGHSLTRAFYRDGSVVLNLLAPDGEDYTVETEHVIAATGYKVDLRKVPFLEKNLRTRLRMADFAPVLSADFESSVPGLYFVGLTAANTFGPSMRFLLGARFTARRIAKHFVNSISPS